MGDSSESRATRHDALIAVSLFILFFIAVFFAFSCAASARSRYGDEPCRPNVEAEGFASTIDRPVQDYKDEALYMARRRVVEKKVGVYIEAETRVANEVLLESDIYKKSEGYVKCDIIEKEWTKDNIYNVKIKAEVQEGKLKDDLRKLVPDDTVIVAITETNIGKPVANPRVQNSVIDEFLQRGFDVKDEVTLKRIMKRDEMIAAMKGDEEAARELSLRFMSNILVTGEAEAHESQNLEKDPHYGDSLKGLKSARATAVFRAVVTDTGSIVCNVHQTGPLGDGVKGFARSWEAAGLRALNELAEAVIEEDIEGCFPASEGENRWIEVVVKDIPSRSEFTKIETILKMILWVEKVEAPDGWNKKQTIFKLLYPAETKNIAVRLDRRDMFRVTEFSKNRIAVIYKMK